ncbi:hypothetical protein BD779DRAFT_1677491 [Infundibulicybe gibba]|nr:hypothetical protein BD779DRAFT_1677491 [Infundibulicybe gibba]
MALLAGLSPKIFCAESVRNPWKVRVVRVESMDSTRNPWGSVKTSTIRRHTPKALQNYKDELLSHPTTRSHLSALYYTPVELNSLILELYALKAKCGRLIIPS